MPSHNAILKAEGDFLVRVGGNVSLLSEVADVQPLGDGQVLCWPREQMNSGSKPLRLRLLKVTIGKTPMWMLTSVLDSQRLTTTMIVRYYKMRWGVELSYHDAKQFLGFHDPQVYCENSVERAAPMAWFLSSLLVLWYSLHGADSEPAHRHRPWYRKRKSPTFADMLSTLRLSLWSHWLEGLEEDAQPDEGSVENAERVEKLKWLLEYLSTAA